MMPEKKLGSGLPDVASTITKPDGSVGSGAVVIKKDYVGPSASAYDWSVGPCS